MKFLFWRKKVSTAKKDFFSSQLFDEKTFYTALIKDLKYCKEEVIIESPYIVSKRAYRFIPIFKSLLARGVKIYVITRNPKEHDIFMERQSEEIINIFEKIGVQVLLCVGNHHRKLAVLDREILYEGSLNILSQTHSREVMRRIHNENEALKMFHFLKYEKYINHFL